MRIAVALGALAIALLVSAATTGGEAGERARPDLRGALADGSVEEAASAPGVGASQGAEITVTGTGPERSGTGHTPTARTARLESCGPAAGAVDVAVSAHRCPDARGLAAEFGDGPGEEPRSVRGFVCTPDADALRATCTRAADLATVVLVFGPGGPGLADCGSAPVGPDGALGQVRAAGVSCAEARRKILRGAPCAERDVAGVKTLTCRRAGRVIAFTDPTASG